MDAFLFSLEDYLLKYTKRERRDDCCEMWNALIYNIYYNTVRLITYKKEGEFLINKILLNVLFTYL